MNFILLDDLKNKNSIKISSIIFKKIEPYTTFFRYKNVYCKKIDFFEKMGI
jgi:hypothetical protein